MALQWDAMACVAGKHDHDSPLILDVLPRRGSVRGALCRGLHVQQLWAAPIASRELDESLHGDRLAEGAPYREPRFCENIFDGVTRADARCM